MCLCVVKDKLGDYQAALDCNKQCQKVQEKKKGKTHPNTRMTLRSMAITYFVGLKYCLNGEEM